VHGWARPAAEPRNVTTARPRAGGAAEPSDSRVRRALGERREGPVGRPPRERPVGWRLSESALRWLLVGVVAGALGLVTGRAWVLAFAAGPVVMLAVRAPRRRPASLEARAEVGTRRCFEGEDLPVRIEVRADGPVGWIDPGVAPGPGAELVSVDADGGGVSLEFTARRWGRWSLGVVDLDVYDSGGLARRTVRVDLGEVEVFPVPTDGSLTPIPVRLPDRLGEHTTRHHGEGVEVIGVRPHVWGERQRRIHWPSTTRRGSLQLNQFAAERTADTVLLLDACQDLIDPATDRSSLDDSLRAASGIARAYLRSHDRVGVVSVGGALRWLRPGTGEPWFYRLVQTVLDVRRDLSFQTPELTRLPPPALPRGALVYAVTPLVDDRVLDVLRDLAERGNPVVVVEVPAGEPRVEPGDAAEQLALRLWRLDREALHFSLQERGIPVLPWDGVSSLDLSLAPLLRTRVQGRAR
jgi:uncharacterized protein (DUF58 family)